MRLFSAFAVGSLVFAPACGAATPASTNAAPTAAHEPVVPAGGVVVKILPGAPEVGAPGARGQLRVAFAIDDGFHVMSDDPSKPNYIATKLALDPIEGVTFGAPVFPAPVMFALGPGDTIRTFVGRVEIVVPFDVASAAAPGDRTVRGTLRYQACTTGNCLFPKTLPVEARIRIDAAAR